MTSPKRSEKRKATIALAGRFTPPEAADLRARAAPHGGISAYIRHRTIGAPLPRSRVEVELLTKVLAELGKIGSNINQIAHHLNAGRPVDRIEGGLEAAIIELLEWRTALMQALGQERKSRNERTQR